MNADDRFHAKENESKSNRGYGAQKPDQGAPQPPPPPLFCVPSPISPQARRERRLKNIVAINPRLRAERPSEKRVRTLPQGSILELKPDPPSRAGRARIPHPTFEFPAAF